MSQSVVDSLEVALKSNGYELSPEERRFIASCQNWPNALVDVSSTIFAARVSERAILKHAASLDAASASSERAAKELARATWALVAFTAVLAVATIVLAIR